VSHRAFPAVSEALAGSTLAAVESALAAVESALAAVESALAAVAEAVLAAGTTSDTHNLELRGVHAID